MIKKITLYLIITLISANLFAQNNLVKDPSFEDFIKYYNPTPIGPGCDTLGTFLSWARPLGSPDYFNAYINRCEYYHLSSGVPKNIYGYAPTVEGNGYFALGLSSIDTLHGPGDWQWLNYEYIEGTLFQPLVQGKEYCVSFYVRLVDSAALTTWCIGAYLSKDSIPDMHSQWDTINNYYLHFTPQIQNAEGNFLNDTAWVKIEGSFIATGGEKYITIGKYIPYARDQYLIRKNINILNDNASIYYVDMVSVYLCEDTIKPEPEQKNVVYIPNVFSPNSDGANDILYVRGENIKEASISIYNRWGEKVFESNDKAKGWDGNYKGKPCPAEVYVYHVKITFNNATTESKSGNVTLVR